MGHSNLVNPGPHTPLFSFSLTLSLFISFFILLFILPQALAQLRMSDIPSPDNNVGGPVPSSEDRAERSLSSAIIFLLNGFDVDMFCSVLRRDRMESRWWGRVQSGKMYGIRIGTVLARY